MKVLSLKESKKIIIKFLKYFGIYDEKKVDKYFNSNAPNSIITTNTEEFGQEFGKALFKSLKMLEYSKKKLKKYYDLSNKKRLFKIPRETCQLKVYEHRDILKNYEDYIEDCDHSYKVYEDFFDAIAKLIDKKIYAVSETWLDKIRDRLVIELSTSELMKNKVLYWNIVNEQKVFLFSGDFSFLVILATYDNIVASNNKFIAGFKKNLSHKNCEKYWNLKEGNLLKITFQKIDKNLVLNKKSKIYKIKKIKIKKNRHWTDELYFYLDSDGLILVVNWLLPLYGIDAVKSDKKKIMHYFSEDNIVNIEIS